MGSAAKKAIISTPGFPSPIPKPDKPTSYRISKTPVTGGASGGLGMVATRDLKMGDLIISERPLFVTCPAACSRAGIPDNTSMEQCIQAMLVQWEKVLEPGFKRMSEDNQAAFKALANSHTEDGSGPILGVIHTNGFGVYLGKNEKENLTSAVHSVVYNHISRVNHSCTPNSAHTFNIALFSGQLRAVRDIKKEEEIIVTYCDIDMTTAARQKKLEPYGFQCTCPSCSDPRSDDKLKAIIKSAQGLGVYRHTGSRTEETRRLEESLRWIQKIEDQGLQKLPA
jgi:hypothetical protein